MFLEDIVIKKISNSDMIEFIKNNAKKINLLGFIKFIL